MDLVLLLKQRQFPRKQDRVEVNIVSSLLPVAIVQKRGIVAKANRIVNGMRNHNVPVDMGDNFYDNGNEYCKYLITDPRSDAYLKKASKKAEYASRHEATPDFEKSAEEVVRKAEKEILQKQYKYKEG